MTSDIAKETPVDSLDPSPETLEAASPKQGAFSIVRQSVEGRVGVVILALVVCLAILGPAFAPFSPYEIEVGPRLSPPSDTNLLGTDRIGRDVFSRFLNGGQSLLIVPIVAVTIALIVGGSLGLCAAFYRGLLETLIMRGFDVMMALPPLVVTLFIVLTFGTSLPVLVLAVSFGYYAQFGRILRGASLNAISSDYVLAAKARGEGHFYVIFREVLPGTLTVVISEYSLRLSSATLVLAGLNFLGFGTQPPEPNWAVMVGSSISTLHVSIWGALSAGLTIAALAMSYNLIGESISMYNSRGTRANRIGC